MVTIFHNTMKNMVFNLNFSVDASSFIDNDEFLNII